MSASRRLSFPALLILVLLSCRAEPSRSIHDEHGTRDFAPAPEGITVVHLWATWCPPCVHELPALDSFVRLGVPRDVSLVLVSTQEPLQRSRAYLEGRGFILKTSADPDGRFRRYLGAVAVPLTVVLAPDGRELERRVGAAPWESPTYRAHLAYLGKKWALTPNVNVAPGS